MFNLPYIPTADELIDKAFRAGAKRAAEVRGSRKPRDVKIFKSELERVEAVGRVVVSDLSAVVKHFPSFEQLPPFHAQLLDIKVDRNRYKKSLGAVQWCRKRVEELTRKTVRDMKKNRDSNLSKTYLGRTSSIIKQIRFDLDRLVEIKGALRRFPDVKDLPTVVVAGYPNVGKSTFVGTLTGSKIKTARYPFTTQKINIGYGKVGYRKIQLIDSPGLLDRPMNERNKIEQQAVLAIKELADVIFFIVDPTADLTSQTSLLREIKDRFNVRILVGIGKKDLVGSGELAKVRKAVDGTCIEFNALDRDDCVRVFDEIVSSMSSG